MNYTADLVVRNAKPVPRYTSYPTAPHFHNQITPSRYRQWLGSVGAGEPVSLYLHIPFCDKLCWFCGCHTKQILRYDPIAPYLKTVYREMAMVAETMNGPVHLDKVHLGGGSPSMLKSDDLAMIREQLEANFVIDDETSISVEIDPTDVTADTMLGLRRLGLTRASIGVQDFDLKVQEAINRPQSFEDTRRVANELNAMGVTSLNIDALYGLPHQTMTTLADSIEKVVSLKPDRVALFGYAHVPWMKKHQTMIDEDHLPDIQERFEQARMAESMLVEAGYYQIGIDHFARPGDALAKAYLGGHLRRNFQGYTDDDCQTLIGLGASSIGQTPSGYVQNLAATGQYMATVNKGELPIAKGIELSDDDRLRAWVIEQIMCNFGFETLELKNLFGEQSIAIIREANQLAASDPERFFVKTPNGFAIARAGRPFARTYAAHFDAWLKENAGRYSIAV